MGDKRGLRKFFVTFFAVLLSVCTVVAGAGVTAHTVNARKSAYLLTVVIDAGHGGIDGGVSGVNTGVAESELNLLIAKLLKEDFKAAGFRTVMTRTSASGLYGAAQTSLKKADMKNRRKIIEECSPDLVISIHMNKYSLASRRGAQVFFQKGDERSHLLADCVQRQLNGMEEATREYSALGGDYYVLKVSPCPAIIVECGFLSNPEDESLLLTEEYRKKISYEIFKGAIAYMSNEATFYQKAP